MDSLETWLASKSQDAQHDTLIPMGEIIGPWKIVALLGKGGSAEVYRVQHTHHNISAALKIITSTDERARERFARERELLQIQTLTCFARFIDSGDWSGRPYIVTEELESFELPHKDPAVTKFILATCNAVASLHAEGYVHRDLKPGNIMRRKDGSYVLIDLGLVKKIDDTGNRRPNWDSLSIIDGKKVVVGTPGFSAPEQFISGSASIESDIHAIGVIVYECFNGKPPAAWNSFINKATSSLKEQRFQTISQVIDELTFRNPKSTLVRWMAGIAILSFYLGIVCCVMTMEPLIKSIFPVDMDTSLIRLFMILGLGSTLLLCLMRVDRTGCSLFGGISCFVLAGCATSICFFGAPIMLVGFLLVSICFTGICAYCLSKFGLNMKTILRGMLGSFLDL